MTEPITFFAGPFHFLSNFYLRPFTYGGIRYPTAEHAYQAQKFWGTRGRAAILAEPTATGAKRVGRSMPMRSDWEQIKVKTMKEVLQAKFAVPELAAKLLETGDAELIEGNTWRDTFWGQCPLGNGKNMLGKLLMEVREEIRNGQE